MRTDTQQFLSTLSLRRATSRVYAWWAWANLFLSTLSLRRATVYKGYLVSFEPEFLSTLSLRRATRVLLAVLDDQHDFYPRSPCGERLLLDCVLHGFDLISIHALLAESDLNQCKQCYSPSPFLSTLSLRRATREINTRGSKKVFLSTLSLRRATTLSIHIIGFSGFLSTLSLRRATQWKR